jgi:hypothetical protein
LGEASKILLSSNIQLPSWPGSAPPHDPFLNGEAGGGV